MTEGHTSAVWHLCRDEKSTGPISDRELYMLAELGHLRPDDFLWRPGFNGWKPAHSIPGLLTPPPPPKSAPALPRKRARKVQRKAVTAVAPPAAPPRPPVVPEDDLALELVELPDTLSDDVPQFLVGLVSKPKPEVGLVSTPKPDWVSTAKDRLRTLRIGSKLGSLGVSAASLGAQMSHVKRQHVVMGVLGGIILIGALSAIIAMPSTGDEVFALRTSALPEATRSDAEDGTANGKVKLQDRFSDPKPAQHSASTSQGSAKPSQNAAGDGARLPSSIEMDPEFLRPKTVPRPGAMENAAATGASKPSASAPKPDSTTTGPSGPSSKPEPTATASSSPSSKPVSILAAPKAPGPSKTVINVNTQKGVKLVQMRLNELGYLSMPPNGIWGDETTKALEAFVAKAKIADYQGWNSTVERALFATEAPRVTASAEPKP